MKSLNEIEADLARIIGKRRGTGGYDVNAEDMLVYAETLLVIVRHLQIYEADTHNGSV